MLDCGGCELRLISDKDNVKAFVKELVHAIGMTAVGEPWIERSAIGISDKEGFSLYQLIVTSNVSAHFVDEARQIYLDMFSCKEFKETVVKKIVVDYFGPTKIKSNFIKRNAEN